MVTTKVEQEVLDLEKRRFEAIVRNDYAALEQILANDLTYIHSNGVFESKAEFIGALKSGQRKYESSDVKEVHARVYGSTAVLTGIVLNRVRGGGGVRDLNLRFTDVYVQRQGKWQMVAWQSTIIAQP
ncbi:MAG: nuclear transport factor 2 family protein [Chloroflexi bacterium]|nr:nuclear transport factor 2 family protein [Chloroflexota bacterium]